jgi:hypothetical protein
MLPPVIAVRYVAGMSGTGGSARGSPGMNGVTSISGSRAKSRVVVRSGSGQPYE